MLKSADLHETILTPVVTSRNITNNKTQEASLLHVVLPLTSCDFCSQILSVYERSIEVFPFFEGGVVFTSESGNLLTYMKNIHFSSSLERPMETSWRNTASRHRDNVHVYDK